jgi:SAM-dependent methyltransferase
MEGMLKPVDEPLIDALRLDAPFRIAEACCGGGGTSLEVRRRAPSGSVVHGFDISAALIETARARIAADDRNIAFDVANMEIAAPPHPPYDRLISRFGIMFFEEPATAFENLFGWLVPGGRFAFVVWANPAHNRWLASVREVAAELIELPGSDPEAPGPFRYAESDKLLQLLERAGFADLAVGSWRGMLPLGGGLAAPEAADFALAAISSFGDLLAEAGTETVHRARKALTERFARHEEDGTVRMAASVHIFTGARV